MLIILEVVGVILVNILISPATVSRRFSLAHLPP